MRKLLITITLLTICMITMAKKYPFDMKHQYRVEQVRVAEDGGRFVKAWGVAGNADKAIIQALQDAVACCVFMGLEAKNSTTLGHNANAVPSLCPEGLKAYEEHKAYFDQFFTKGDFLLYAANSNTGYPTGENNVKTKDGRQVGIYVVLKVDQLRKRLEQDGIIKSFETIWE